MKQLSKKSVFLFLIFSVFFSVCLSETKEKTTVYKDLKKKTSKYLWSKELFKVVFDVQESEKKTAKTQNNVTVSAQRFKKYDGKRIRKILIKQEDVFDGKDFLSRAANKSHIQTREMIIRGGLFFQEYSMVDSKLLAENEKYINDLSYINDANFYLVPVKGSTDFVDLVLIVRDKWTIGVVGYLTSQDKFKLGIYDKNFLGLGNEFKYTAKYEKGKSPEWGNDFSYTIRNIDESFVDLTIDYFDDYSRLKYGGSLNRNYITGKKYGGGLDWHIEEEKEQKSEVKGISTISTPKSKKEIFDCWFGRKYNLWKPLLGFEGMAIAIRHKSANYLIRPAGVKSDSLRSYHNVNYFRLVSFSFNTQDFYRSSLIYGFGVTEYIPYGKKLELVYGRESGEFVSRDYFGISYSYAKFYKNVGYLYNKLSLGGFWVSDNDVLEDLTLRMRTSYFSLLYKWGTYYTRFFADLNYVTSVRRSLNDSIGFRDEEIRELSLSEKNEQKFVLSTEMVSFAPYNLVGFRFAFFTFADGGFLSENENIAVGGKFASSIGFGVRIRNENLVFKTLQLRFAYFPVQQDDGAYKFRLSGEKDYSEPNLDAGAPEIIQYY